MKGDAQVILLIIFFFLGFAVYGLSENWSIWLSQFQVATVAATLGAAFLGAKYAFTLQNEREKKRILEDQVEAGNYALFQLSRVHQYFGAIRKEYQDLKGDPDRDLLIRPFIGISGFELTFEFRGLSFLYHSQDPNILNKLAAFQAEVASVLDVIYQRNQIHQQYAQPANEKAFLKNHTIWDPKTVKTIMGLNQSINLKEATDAMIDGIESVIEGALELSVDLRRVLEIECPKQPFVSYKPNQSLNTDAGKAGAGQLKR